jgi:hypothetical protein
MPGPLLGKDSLVALLDVVSILWRILEDFEVLVPYPYSRSFLSNNYSNSCRVLSVRIPCGIPSSLFHIPFPQFQFIHPPPPLDKKMVEFSNDFKVKETSISADSIHHEKSRQLRMAHTLSSPSRKAKVPTPAARAKRSKSSKRPRTARSLSFLNLQTIQRIH